MIKATATTLISAIVAGLLVVPQLANSATIPTLEAGKGLVVFYRPTRFAGGAIRFNVNYAGGSLGVLGSGTMLYRHLEPGQYQFWSQVISQDAITISV